MFLWTIIGIVLLLIFICEVYAFKTGVPTVTTVPSVRKKMVEILKREEERRVKDEPFTILDLGSGTGKLALSLGRALPTARVIGLEISIIPFFLSLIRQAVWNLFWKVDNVEFKRLDFWPYNLSEVDAVVLYINANIRARMATKLRQDLPHGALIISNETYLPDWEPCEMHAVGLLKVKVVVYRQP